MAVELFEEHAHVLETGVHALPVEGHHGVCGVADDDDRGGVVVRGALDGDEGEVGVSFELVDELVVRDEGRGDAGEVLIEEFGEACGGVFGEGVEVVGRSEEGAGEGTVG